VAVSLIGTDEAGYGPNLGPLTIAGTLWSAENYPFDWYRQLAASVSRDYKAGNQRLVIADSKKVHRPDDLSYLELPVLALLHSMGEFIPNSLPALCEMLISDDELVGLRNQFWWQGCELKLPIKVKIDDVEKLSERFRQDCSRNGIGLKKVTCRSIFPNEFNQLLNGQRNKADLLSANTLKIVRTLMDGEAIESMVSICCDRHGGRSKYLALLQACLTTEFVSVVSETHCRSAYRFRENQLDVSIEFTTNGESFLPTAVSSMIAKYLREVTMVGWNQFWQQHVPALQPTKGYPTDAKRFIKEIDSVRRKLGIELETIWRNR
jgi:ribonuclease HII